MIEVLVDYNLEGHANLLWRTIQGSDLLDFAPTRFVRFSEVNLLTTSNDRVVWRFAQSRGMVLLTGNRNMKGGNSLETTLREEVTADSLPVLMIGNTDRLMAEREYREQCAFRLMDILLDMPKHRGISRLYIP